jgi:nicotinate phosphoribosyltransferase
VKRYRYKPEQVTTTFTPVSQDGNKGRIEIQAAGLWSETIFWEVPLMACLSETFFKTVDTDWNMEGQEGTPH